jgi:hypothetical protein
MRSAKPLATLVVLLAGLGAYIYFVESKKEPGAEDARPKVFEVSAEKIAELTVRSGGDRTVLRKTDGQWRIVEPVQVKADEGEVSGLTGSLASAENVRVVDEAPGDLSQYGLAEPRVEVGFRVDGEKEFRHLRLGDKTATQGEVYASRGGKQVFLIPSYLESSFAKSTFDLREKGVLAFERDKVDRLEIEAPGQSLAVAKAGTEWRLEKPVQAPADYGTVESLVSRLQTAQMKSIAAQEAADLKPYGLDAPEATIAVASGSSRASLAIGKKDESGNHYARDLSRPLVFTVEPSLLDELKKPAGDLRNKDVFAFRPFNATAIETTRGTEVLAFEKAKGPGKDDTEKWRQVKPSVKDVDQSKVDDALARLSNLRVQSFEDGKGKTGADAPALVVVAKFEEGKKTERVAFARSGSDVFASIEGQPGAAKVDAAEFDQALKALDALK